MNLTEVVPKALITHAWSELKKRGYAAYESDIGLFVMVTNNDRILHVSVGKPGGPSYVEANEVLNTLFPTVDFVETPNLGVQAGVMHFLQRKSKTE